MSNITKRFIKNIHSARRFSALNWAFADQAVVSAGNFFTSLLVARFLGVEAFGIFSVIWLVLLFMQSIQSALLISPMLSIGPKNKQYSASAYYRGVQTLQCIVSIVSALAAAAVLKYGGRLLGIGEYGDQLALSFAGVIVITQLHEFFRCYCYAKEFSYMAFQIDLIRYCTQIILLIGFAAYGYLTLSYSLLTIIVSAILGIAVLFRHIPAFTYNLAMLTQIFLRHWNMSKWGLPANLVYWLTGNLFVLASSSFLGPQAVGAMRANQNLLGVTHIFFQAMDRWANVRAARIFTDQKIAGLRLFVGKMHFLIVGATTCVIVALVIPADFWLTFLYGSDYASYAWMAWWYGAAYLIIAANAPYRYALNAMETLKPLFFGYLLAAIFSGCSVYPLLKNYHILGALAGNFFCQLLLLLVLFLGWKRLYTKKD